MFLWAIEWFCLDGSPRSFLGFCYGGNRIAGVQLLEKGKGCMVYKDRPSACRTYPLKSNSKSLGEIIVIP
jgi:hypothetical protein